jgi:hypothetical protein
LTFPRDPYINSAQINAGLAMIPKNASVMTQISIATHLFYIRNLELTPNYNNATENLTYNWVAPDYIVLDKNISDYNLFLSNSFNVYDYMAKNYTIYYNASGFYIYKRVR